MNEELTRQIIDWLEDRGYGTFNTDMFIGTLPEDVTTGLFIVAAPSPEPHKYIDTESIVIDFWYRHPKSNLAYEKLRDIYNLLHRRANWTLTDYYIYFSNALGEMRDIDRDQEGGKLYALSIRFVCRNLNNVS